MRRPDPDRVVWVPIPGFRHPIRRSDLLLFASQVRSRDPSVAPLLTGKARTVTRLVGWVAPAYVAVLDCLERARPLWPIQRGGGAP